MRSGFVRRGDGRGSFHRLRGRRTALLGPGVSAAPGRGGREPPWNGRLHAPWPASGMHAPRGAFRSIRSVNVMSTSFRLLGILVAAAPLMAACARPPQPPEERAFEACRGEVARRLVDPTSARYGRLRVERRFGDGASVVDGWDVQISVEARAGDKKTARSTVLCTLGTDLELLDLSGEQQVR